MWTENNDMNQMLFMTSLSLFLLKLPICIVIFMYMLPILFTLKNSYLTTFNLGFSGLCRYIVSLSMDTCTFPNKIFLNWMVLHCAKVLIVKKKNLRKLMF